MEEKSQLNLTSKEDIEKLNKEIRLQREKEKHLNPTKEKDRYEFEIQSLKKELRIVKEELEKCQKMTMKQ
tara:strand:+ start:304 stop:513 length:210 start_codon:yes stop_codon:yes gene_type:complete